MQKQQLNSKGFGLIAVIIVIAVLVVLGGAGVYVYQRNHTANSAANAKVTNHTTAKTDGSSGNKSNPSTGSQQTYLTIREWGVKLPLSDTIKGAYYVASNSSKDASGQPDTMWLGLTSLNSKGCDATLANQGQSTQLGALLRVSPTATDPVSGTSYTQLYPNGITIGNYYYAYKSWTKGKACASETQLQAIDSAFATATKNAVTTNN